MDALRRKLHDQRGVSMLMALLLMLVALMVSAVVVAGASSAVSALRTDQKQEQAALTVTFCGGADPKQLSGVRHEVCQRHCQL